jgi:hypothetical protein
MGLKCSRDMENRKFIKGETVAVTHTIKGRDTVETGMVLSVGSKNMRVLFKDGGELTFPLSTLSLGKVNSLIRVSKHETL